MKNTKKHHYALNLPLHTLKTQLPPTPTIIILISRNIEINDP